MKPLKITLTAFGPYKHKEVIDFSDLQGHRLFVISGNTGAGKTTIFDAICFSLYGVASGEDRSEVKMLRSQFADDDTHTAVELEFELKGRTYRVLRQIPHVKQGNKTATGEKYELYETTSGKEMPLCDRFIVSQVDKKIEEIIGISKEQFSQIVMLPQGEFRKLLTSKTEDKEDILRRIFKTTVYKNIVEKMNDKTKHAKHLYDDQKKERDLYINHLKAALPARDDSQLTKIFSQDEYNTHQVLSALDVEIDYYKEEKAQKDKALIKENERYEKLSEQYHHAKSINERFKSLDEKKAKKVQMDEKLPIMKSQKLELQLAEQASKIEPYERNVISMTKEVNDKKIAYVEKKKHLEEIEKTLQSATNEYKIQEAKQDERKEVSRELDHLKQWLPTVKGYEQRQAEVLQLKNKVEKMTLDVQRISEGLQAKQQEKETKVNTIKSLDEQTSKLPEMQETLREMGSKFDVLTDYLKTSAECDNLQKGLKEKEEAYNKAKENYMKFEETWIEGQASLLAAHLHDGKECPVCGSLDHPLKAMSSEQVPSREQLDQLSQQKDLIQNEFTTLNGKYDIKHTQFYELKEKARKLGFEIINAEEQYKETEEKGKKLKEEVLHLRSLTKKVQDEKVNLEKLESEIVKRTKEKDELFHTMNELNISFTKEKVLLDQSIESIPKEFRSLKQLEKRFQLKQSQLDQLEKMWKVAQEQLDKAKENHATAKANEINAESQVKEFEQKKADAISEFEKVIYDSGFASKEKFTSAKRSEDERQNLKESIELFKTNYETIKKQLEELEMELKGKERFSLDELQKVLNEQGEVVERCRKELQKVETYYQSAKDAYLKISKVSEKVYEAEKKYLSVKDIHDTIRGDNQKRISFERYLQIEFLEQIVNLANERLNRLSNGQFKLVRSNRLEKNKRQSGLSLDVYDNYTGQLRDVKTLSGGEKFNASLCLALGMADVIQAYEGGISIETMFIDEGFGSLDEESLTKAIDALIDLQQTGRMIGVISHVQELKQAIPAILDVKKTKEGFSRTSFVVR